MPIVTILTNGTTHTLIDGATGTGAGSALKPKMLHRTFQVIISATATCKLQASNDNSTWIDLRTSTASEGYSTAEPWQYIRGNVTAHSSGTVDLIMAT